ncbi:MAG: L-threonylcarbamoyladenylate synthase [Syntrophomonadaceae bacterium]|nr:L-threonylcarbamoyladenylate synthase [Syntrophomonadaceae bacterium]
MLQTQYFKVNPLQPEIEIIKQAAQYIKNLELVAFPTETVYGLGAMAYNPEAVNKIFIAKARPAANPLLVHVSNTEQVKEMVTDIPAVARILMAKYWPGPLSIVLSARETVPSVVTGGKNTVGLRMPDHRVALALIEEAGPIAAPSANLSGHPSPVTAAHVKDDLDGRIAAVLDAGTCGLGLESTIIDLSQGRLILIRRGAVAVENIEEITGQKVEMPDTIENQYAHHQINAEVIICENQVNFEKQIEKMSLAGKKVAVVFNDQQEGGWQRIINNKYSVQNSYVLDISSGSSNLYAILRDVEQQNIDILVFAPLASESSGFAASLLERIYQSAKKAGSEA